MINTNVIYADIESILDIRQGVMSLLGESADDVFEYMISREYNQRSTDDLKFISGKHYREMVNTGSELILKGSLPAYNLGNVSAELAAIATKATVSKEVNIGEIWINVYPFKLQDEGIELLKAIIFTKLDCNSVPRIVSLPNKDVTPNFIKTNNIKLLYIYNTSEWLEANGQAIIDVDIRDVRFMFSPILTKKPTKEEAKELEEEGYGDLSTFLSLAVSPFINTEFLPIAFYNNFVTSKNIIIEYLNIIGADAHAEGDKMNISEEELDGILGDVI